MLIRKTTPLVALNVLFLVAIMAGSVHALVEPDRSGVGQAEFRLAELTVENSFRASPELPPEAAENAAADLAALGLDADAGLVDVRGGRWATLILAKPLLPGGGAGNDLSWANLGRAAPKNDAEHSAAASQAFSGFLEANSNPLRIDTLELGGPGKVTLYRDGTSIQIYIPRVFEGVPVRGSYLTGTINHGNLILFGAQHWGDINTSTDPGISGDAALQAVQSYVEPHPVNSAWGKTELVLVPVVKGRDLSRVPVGQGLDYRLAWVIRPAFDGDMRRFESLVDAHSGELLSFEDTNQYAATPREVKGGVFPVTNDGIVPDGVEQAGWPMPFDNVSTPGGTVTTDSGGNLPVPVDGVIESNLSGPFIRMNDNCGSISLTDTDDIDFGTSGGTDCATPGFGGAGNTHASRTGFHELNRIKEMGRGQLPSNTWLQQQLTSNMNINNTCNAFWNGTVNFYRSGGGCSNTGEIAGVFDHEWGHGMDANDATPGIAQPSGEGIADIYTALRLNDSCIGRNFRASVCSGNGDPCLTCTGVRDIDYLKRASGNPHDYSWSNANCGGSVHCKGGVYSEAVWSLWKRELQSAPYNMDNNTAHEIVTRLTFIGAGNTGTWFSGGPPNGGCAGSSGYLNYLAADDDNGNLNDGTPHMRAIFEAFNDQEIACATPTVQDSGCAGTPTLAPVVTASPLDKSVSLSWGAVAGASGYEVFRTDGVFQCDFGKVKIGETGSTSFNDSGLQNGRDYSYVVIPKGGDAACFGSASSCTTVAPAAGPNLDVDPDSAVLAINTGDGDPYIDNCEDGMMTFDVTNTGLGILTNVRITGVAAVSHPATTITTAFPAFVSPSSLAQGATGSGSFDFIAGGLAFGDTLVFEVTVTADEMAVAKTQTLTIDNAETDLQAIASQTWDFETDLDGWTLIEGTFNQTTLGGGAGGSAGYVASSSNLANQCDQVRSPAFRLTASSTMTLQNNYDIEDFSSGSWWDRANIAIFEAGTRNSVDPDGGRLYNASGAGATCATVGQDGWANVNDTWGSSSWSAGALGSAGFAGKTVQLDVAYGTDAFVHGSGFWFDQVTLTDIEGLVADGQSDTCDGNQLPVVTITAPNEGNDGWTVNHGVSVDFAGTATDPEDGDLTASLAWTSDLDGSIGNGASFSTSTLSVGVHTITAAVTDEHLPPALGEDQITVTILNQPPVVEITAPTDGLSFDQGASVNFTGTALDPEDGDISANLAWTSNLDGSIGSGAGFSTSTLSVGAHTITAAVTDSNSAPDSDQIAVTINLVPATSVHVASVVTGSQNVGGGNKVGTATITLVDEHGSAVANHTVTGDFSVDITEPGVVSGLTGADGTVTILTTAVARGKVSVLFCVSNVAGANTYVPLDNAQGTTCTILNQPPVVEITAPTDGLSFDQGASVNFTGTALDPEDGDISANLAWTSNLDGSIGSGAGFSTSTLSVGAHTITAAVTDSNSAPDSDQIAVTINLVPATSVHVASVVTGSQNVGGGNKVGTATITLVDEHGSAVANHTVTGDFSVDITEPGVVSGLTGADGTVTILTTAVARGKVSVLFCVSNVAGANTYVPLDNAQGTTCPP